MQKQIIKEPINYEIDFNDLHIDDLQEHLNRMKLKGATHIDIDCDTGMTGAFLVIDIYKSRFETDEEIAKRITLKEQRKEIEKERELRTLAVLKAKYENQTK